MNHTRLNEARYIFITASPSGRRCADSVSIDLIRSGIPVIKLGLYALIDESTSKFSNFVSSISQIDDSSISVLILGKDDALKILNHSPSGGVANQAMYLGYILGLLRGSSSFIISQGDDFLEMNGLHRLIASSGLFIINVNSNKGMWYDAKTYRPIKDIIIDAYNSHSVIAVQSLSKDSVIDTSLDSGPTVPTNAEVPMRLFCSYSHKDERHRRALEP